MKNNKKVYYKVLDNNMKTPYIGFQYELGEAYLINDSLKLCKRGFHACENMYELLLWADYNALKECRFFECTLGDKIIEDDHKVVSNSITLVKEIPFEEVDKSIRKNLKILVHDKNNGVRVNIARQGYGLDILIHDESWHVRKAVAEQGYGLDILINDKYEYVRREVANHGYGLDILINDKSPNVRAAVAKQRYRLDVLIHDNNWAVRAAIASQGYRLDILIHDESWRVRETVALQGYGLDILIHDEDWDVRYISKQMLNKEKRNG